MNPNWKRFGVLLAIVAVITTMPVLASQDTAAPTTTAVAVPANARAEGEAKSNAAEKAALVKKAEAFVDAFHRADAAALAGSFLKRLRSADQSAQGGLGVPQTSSDREPRSHICQNAG